MVASQWSICYPLTVGHGSNREYLISKEAGVLNQRKVWINGEIVPWEGATVHLMSHSFGRGSAIFEVFGFHETVNGSAFFRIDEHMKRLARSAELLNMKLAQSSEEIKAAIKETVKANGLTKGAVKIFAYYGNVAFVIMPLQETLDLAISVIDPEADIGGTGFDLDKPLSVCISPWQKLSPKTIPVEAKVAANYMNGLLARQDAISRGFDLGIMLGDDGNVTEGSIEAAFMVKDGVIKTAPMGRILSSISRKSVLEAAWRTGLEAVEEPIKLEEFMAADEIFISATPFKAQPVGRIEDRVLEAPGPVNRQLNELLGNICLGKDDRFLDWLTPVE